MYVLGASDDIEAVKEFFLQLFLAAKDHLYPHFTQATDTSNIKFVFDAVQSTILQNHLTEYHIV